MANQTYLVAYRDTDQGDLYFPLPNMTDTFVPLLHSDFGTGADSVFNYTDGDHTITVNQPGMLICGLSVLMVPHAVTDSGRCSVRGPVDSGSNTSQDQSYFNFYDTNEANLISAPASNPGSFSSLISWLTSQRNFIIKSSDIPAIIEAGVLQENGVTLQIQKAHLAIYWFAL